MYQRQRQALRTFDTNTLQRSKWPPAKGLKYCRESAKINFVYLNNKRNMIMHLPGCLRLA